jgi:SAM-dependent methyltransferase
MTAGKPQNASFAGPMRPRSAGEFDGGYEGKPAWDIGRPQPAFQELAESGAFTGRILDVGCGTGEHVLMTAALGLDSTGVDFAAKAVAAAEARARQRHLEARFLVLDALELESLGEQFDTVLDCGLFHVLEDDDRPRFVAALRAVMLAGGRYFMLCFSEREPGTFGPRRIRADEIRSTFSNGIEIEAIEPALLEVTTDHPGGRQAWLALVRRG